MRGRSQIAACRFMHFRLAVTSVAPVAGNASLAGVNVEAML